MEVNSNPRNSRRRQLSSGERPVSEQNRISIADTLEEFKRNSEKELKFGAGLSNHDRALVHSLSKKLGLQSKSHGKGDGRQVTVYKEKNRNGREDLSSVIPLKFSPSSQEILYQLMMEFPPTELELSTTFGERPEKSADSIGSKGRNSNSGVEMNRKVVSSLSNKVKNLNISGQGSKLPIAKYRESIIEAVERNQVVLIAGETGCGKTTQVPQFLLDHNGSKGNDCKIFCSQPRRISAISVAERVAYERGEAIGNTVGYQIRLESKGGPNTALMFCTTGILLRKLVEKEASGMSFASNGGFHATHIIIDEIHERDQSTDFILIILRELLPSNPNLKIVLMSATMDADLFSSYFKHCPVIHVPGFTFPVQSYFLEDILKMTGYGSRQSTVQNSVVSREVDFDEALSSAMEEAIDIAWNQNDFSLLAIEMFPQMKETKNLVNFQMRKNGISALMVSAAWGRQDELEELVSLGADLDLKCKFGKTAMDYAASFDQAMALSFLKEQKAKMKSKPSHEGDTELLKKYQMSTDQEEVDINLIEFLLCYLFSSKNPNLPTNGAVLVFLPGWDEISRAKQQLQSSKLLSRVARVLLLPLHSQIPSAEQKKVFERPPNGVRKVILSTNIAETAVTIEDVVFVIDSGRVKEKSYDPFSNVSTFQLSWISKASSRQRAGRAGRVRPGVCVHLYSRARAESLPEYQIPEIKRTPLEELCLQVKILHPSQPIRDFVAKAIEPPLDISVQNAVQLLTDIGALTFDERLTHLGKNLGSLPLHPTISKMIIHSILLKCLSPALTVAVSSSYKDPFLIPMDARDRQRAAAVKEEFGMAYGGGSDHLALISVFEEWEMAKNEGYEERFCRASFVSEGVMRMISGLRAQLLRELCRKGFVENGGLYSNENSRNGAVIRACLAAGMYPMIGSLSLLKNQLEIPANKKSIVIATSRGEKVRISPHSMVYKPISEAVKSMSSEFPGVDLIVFDEITRGENFASIRSSTIVSPLSLVLIASEMVVAPVQIEPEEDMQVKGAEKGKVGEDNESDDEESSLLKRGSRQGPEDLMTDPNGQVAVVVDRWLRFLTTAIEAAQLVCLHERMAAAFSFKVRHPGKPLPEVYSSTLAAITSILSFEDSFNTRMNPVGNHPLQ